MKGFAELSKSLEITTPSVFTAASTQVLQTFRCDYVYSERARLSRFYSANTIEEVYRFVSCEAAK
jgi:RNA-binding protein YlmH